MRILSTNPPEGKSKTDPRTAPQRVSSPLCLVTARAAHATPSAVVTRQRYMLADESGARNVAENPPAFVVSNGRRVYAGRDASPSAIDALHRNAQAAEAERPTWRERRAA